MAFIYNSKTNGKLINAQSSGEYFESGGKK